MRTNSYSQMQEQCIKDLEADSFETKFVVTLSKCSMAAGAGEVLSAISDAVAEENVAGVGVEVSGCGGLCHAEPIVTVKRKGTPDIVYGNVTPLKAYSIVVAHGIYNKAILPWVYNR